MVGVFVELEYGAGMQVELAPDRLGKGDLPLGLSSSPSRCQCKEPGKEFKASSPGKDPESDGPRMSQGGGQRVGAKDSGFPADVGSGSAQWVHALVSRTAADGGFFWRWWTARTASTSTERV